MDFLLKMVTFQPAMLVYQRVSETCTDDQSSDDVYQVETSLKNGVMTP